MCWINSVSFPLIRVLGNVVFRVEKPDVDKLDASKY